jgi:hypothetical protein
MDDASVGVLIVGSIAMLGLIQLLVWIVIMIKDPSFNYMRPELPAAPADGLKPRQPIADCSSSIGGLRN